MKENETIFFDDNITAIQTAANVGLFTVGVYDESGIEFSKMLIEISDVYIKTFVGLAQLW